MSATTRTPRDAAPAAGETAGAPTANPRARPSTSPRSFDAFSLLRIGLLALAGSWLGFFLCTPMPALTFHVFPQTLTLHLVAAGGFLFYIASLAAARRLPGGTPLDLPLLLFIAVLTLATWSSVDWRASLEPLLLTGAAIAAFYVLADVPLLDARSLRWAFMLAGLALAAYALWVVGNDYADYLRLTREVEGLRAGNIFPPTVPRVHGVSDHPNVLAMVLVLLLPFYTLAAFRPMAWEERLIGIAGLFAAGWAIFLTLSRGGWIGAAAGVAATIAGAWITVRAHERERRGERLTWEAFVPAGVTPTALAAVAGALALAVFGLLAFVANSSTRPGWLFRGSLSARQDAWDVGLEIFRDNLLLGTGPNTFGLLFPSYSEHAAQFAVHTQHAHNGFLQLANDAGLAGLAALLVVVLAASWMLWQTWRVPVLEARLTAVAAAAALLGFALHQQLDAGNTWKAPAFALAAVGAIIARSWRETRPPQPARAAAEPAARRVAALAPLAARVALPLLLLPLLYGWYRVDAAHYDYWRGLDAWNQGDAAGIARLQDAVDGDSSLMVYHLQLGVAQATAFDAGGRTDDGLLDAALIHLERAVAIDPRSGIARANLARVYELAGRDDDAAREAQMARLATHHVTPVLAAGEVYEDLGRDDDAVSTYGQVISMDAGLANSTFWERTPWRRAHYDDILNASTIAYSPCTFGAFLVERARTGAGDDRPAIEQAKDDCQFQIFTGGLGNDLPSRTALAGMLSLLGERDDAYGHLAYAIGRQPDYGPARTEMGRWHADGGDLERARHEWVVGGELGEGESLRLLGDTYPPGEVPRDVRERLERLVATSGSSVQNDLVSVLYFRMRFGRLSPVFALTPRTWQDAVPRPFAEWRAALDRWGVGG